MFFTQNQGYGGLFAPYEPSCRTARTFRPLIVAEMSRLESRAPAVKPAVDGRAAGATSAGGWRAAASRALRRRLRAQLAAGARGRRHRPRRRQAARDGDARARGGRHQGRADRPEARHGDRRRRQAGRSSSRPCGATSRPTAGAPSWPSPTTGWSDAGRRDFTFNALYADPDGHDLRSVRRPRRSRGRPACASSAIPTSASPRTICASCASSASTPGSASRRSTAAGFDACRRNAGALRQPVGRAASPGAAAPAGGAGAGRRARGDGRGRRARSLAAGILPAPSALRGADRARRHSPIRCAAWPAICRRRVPRRSASA